MFRFKVDITGPDLARNASPRPFGRRGCSMPRGQRRAPYIRSSRKFLTDAAYPGRLIFRARQWQVGPFKPCLGLIGKFLGDGVFSRRASAFLLSFRTQSPRVLLSRSRMAKAAPFPVFRSLAQSSLDRDFLRLSG